MGLGKGDKKFMQDDKNFRTLHKQITSLNNENKVPPTLRDVVNKQDNINVVLDQIKVKLVEKWVIWMFCRIFWANGSKTSILMEIRTL